MSFSMDFSRGIRQDRCFATWNFNFLNTRAVSEWVTTRKLLRQVFANTSCSTSFLGPFPKKDEVVSCCLIYVVQQGTFEYRRLEIFSYASFPYFNKYIVLAYPSFAARQRTIIWLRYIYYNFLKRRIYSLLGMKKSLVDFFAHKYIMFEKILNFF